MSYFLVLRIDQEHAIYQRWLACRIGYISNFNIMWLHLNWICFSSRECIKSYCDEYRFFTIQHFLIKMTYFVIGPQESACLPPKWQDHFIIRKKSGSNWKNYRIMYFFSGNFETFEFESEIFKFAAFTALNKVNFNFFLKIIRFLWRS